MALRLVPARDKRATLAALRRYAAKLRAKHVLKQAKALDKAHRPDDAIALLTRYLGRHSDQPLLHNLRSAIMVSRERATGTSHLFDHIELAQEIDIPTLCQCFWDAEQSLSLVDFQVSGIHIWPVIRMRQFYKIAQQLGLYDAPHPVKRRPRSRREGHDLTEAALARCHDIRGETAAPNQKPEGQAQVAILVGTRKIGADEPYTQALREEASGRALVLDIRHNGQVLPGAIDFDRLVDTFRHDRAYDCGILFSPEAIGLLEDLREILRRRLGIDVGALHEKSAFDLTVFASVFNGFKVFWAAHPVETLFVTNGYSVKIRAAVAAAQSCGIKVVELQHGFISRFHLGYSWPGYERVPYMPDALWCFGAYWSDVTPLPTQTETRAIGAPYIEKMAEVTETPREPGLVTVSSQGVVGRQLFEAAVAIAKAHPDKRVVFRLHPSEDLATFQGRMNELDDAPVNLSISHRDPVIFKVLAATDILVGAFSTTLLEGMALGCRTIVLKLPGIEYMQPIIERGDTLMVETVPELLARLDEAPCAQDPTYYYAPPVEPLLGEQQTKLDAT